MEITPTEARNEEQATLVLRLQVEQDPQAAKQLSARLVLSLAPVLFAAAYAFRDTLSVEELYQEAVVVALSTVRHFRPGGYAFGALVARNVRAALTRFARRQGSDVHVSDACRADTAEIAITSLDAPLLLEAAGFTEVDCVWRNWIWGIVTANRTVSSGSLPG